jgi:hypothetical protein
MAPHIRYAGPTLLAALDALAARTRLRGLANLAERPLRVCVTDLYRSQVAAPCPCGGARAAAWALIPPAHPAPAPAWSPNRWTLQTTAGPPGQQLPVE